jgi:Heterokaryon incompatibility protein (HET)
MDALCIIQDSAADKAEEIRAMGVVYGKVTLAITVTSSRNVNAGILKELSIPHLCSLPQFPPSGEMGTILVRHPFTGFINQPLDTRAWALQESVLSPRLEAKSS